MATHTFVAGDPFTAAQATFVNTGADSGTYTPTLTGMVIGSGGTPLNTATYTYIGGLLFVYGHIKFGTSGQTFPTAPTISLPSGYVIEAAPTLVTEYMSKVTFIDLAPASYHGVCRYATTTTLQLQIFNAASTYLQSTAVSTSAPFTWASGDEIQYQYLVPATG